MSECQGRGKTLHIDYSKCIGCETCEAVCGFLYDTPRIAMARTNDGQMIPIYCQHCEQAHCMKVCNRGALMRDRDGAVVLQPMLCRGCETRNCVIACPYAAFFATDRGVAVRKCDLCVGRRAVGLGPACAEMCPCGAIRFADRDELDELETEASREARDRVLAHIRPKK
ncbi:4Fe-4S binding protein [Nitratidesulfovibrio sp. HK-II]|jgi:Fe-S-cluster-containing dehydrogenase component|uniref:4Fe-4S dicluster domain-containing protein n=1 Tax=Nitratidesulfovibrio sp. HK-II TaxID=2009266 RepID=UPI0002275507|nr:4Fe-4S dicluster domain-containing protein [Nitratidesulfovibrio sp. HK-II]EGY27278.1 4Fe-4S binding domain protein [Desulfovibrio sp. A2]GBO95849.1 Fe-S-cluster-containing hydrogenase components 1 [Nitratidesulfovibrio sp. HK-II]